MRRENDHLKIVAKEHVAQLAKETEEAAKRTSEALEAAEDAAMRAAWSQPPGLSAKPGVSTASQTETPAQTESLADAVKTPPGLSTLLST